MLLSFNWLKEFIPYTGTAEELGSTLTMLGLELEEIEHPFAEIAGVRVGRVLTCAPHPDSDHMHVCTVDVGEAAPASIVCGAPNVAAGQLVAVACLGCTLPGGIKIKKTKLRGVPSEGMICSERELGLTEDHSGILVLPETDRDGAHLKIGTPVVEALGLDTEVLNISITPNRADCLSVLGFARVLSAYLHLPMAMPKCSLEEKGEDCSQEIPIVIEDPSFCPAYTGRVIEDAKTAPSPWWVRYRLHAVGVRPISNLVDATNYVLMELGQPLHAFDADTLEGGTIIVRRAAEGSVFTTLDGKERVLKASDGVICDAKRPVALAGVMGGLQTEISDSTKRVFLECALFEPRSIRMTARRLGLSSESSYRFERGVDQTGMDFARDRAAYLMQAWAGASVRRGVCRSEPKPFIAEPIQFRPARVDELLGIHVEPEFSEEVLRSLGCSIAKSKKDKWVVYAPGWRYDLAREADLVEEIAIFSDVDSMPAALPKLSHSLDRFGAPENRHMFAMRLKRFLAGLGLNEVVNYSFVSDDELDFLGLPKEGRVNILNPLTAEQNVLRTELAPGLLQNVRTNIAHGADGVRIFEIAQAFTADPASDTTVREVPHLAVTMYGSRYDSAWPHESADADYSDLRGIIDHIFRYFLRMDPPALSVMSDHPYLLPAVALTLPDGSRAGVMGRVRPSAADAYYARKPIWYAELGLDLLQEKSKGRRPQFSPLPVFPPVLRDITLACPPSVTVEEAAAAILSAPKCPLLKKAELIDIYVPAAGGVRRLTFRLTFQSDKTLQDADAEKEKEKIAAHAVKTLGAML